MDTFSQTFSQYFSSIQNDETIKEYQAQLQSLSLQKQQEAAQPFQDIGMALVGESAREIGGAIVKNVIDKGKNYIMNQSKSLMKDAMEKVGIDGDTIEQTLQGNLGAAMKGKVSDLLDAAKSKGESGLSDIKSQGESLLNEVQNKAIIFKIL